MDLSFGFSKKNITPGFRTNLACSQQKDTLFERIHDDIFVRCAFLRNNDRNILVISYDLLFHSRDLYDSVYSHIIKSLDISMSDILINYTHNHNAPSVLGYNDFSASEEYEDLLIKSTFECIDEAMSSMEPGYMEYGIIPGNWNINRRRKTSEGIKLAPNPDGPVDSNLYVLKFLSETGKLRGLLVNYSCHPVHYPDTLGLTSEYPGRLCRYLEEEFQGCMPLFLQGAGADSRPLSTAEGDRFVHRSFDHIDKMAFSMKQAIAYSINSDVFRRINPDFNSISFEIEIGTHDEGRAYFKNCINDENLSGHLRRNAGYIYENYDSIKESFTLSCGIIKVSDDLLIVHMGGEPVCEIRFSIENSLDGYDIIFAGYTDACAYIVTDEMLDEGGYEVRCFLEYMHKGKIKKGIGELITGRFQAALQSMG